MGARGTAGYQAAAPAKAAVPRATAITVSNHAATDIEFFTPLFFAGSFFLKSCRI
jgi:hypothetical protein